jgi:carbamoyl-phosphate synthase large subunit
MKKEITILLTGAGAPGAPGIIDCYHANSERKIKIIGVDINENASGRTMVDKFYSVPNAKSDDFIPTIFDICKKEDVDIVVPLVTKELMKFAQSIELFETIGTKISVMEKEKLAIANDKGNLLDAIKANGLKTPRYRIVYTIEEMKRAFKDLGYPQKPICIKVTDGNGSRGVRMVDSTKTKYEMFINEKPNSSYISYVELLNTFKDNAVPKMMVMEFLPGDEYTVDVLADNGEIIAMACRKGTRVVSSIQLECVIVRNKKVENMCRNIIKMLEFNGAFGFDIKCDVNANPYVIEINPRLTAGIVACAAAGCNLPYMDLLRILGEKIHVTQAKVGTRMVRHWKESFFNSDGKKIEWR